MESDAQRLRHSRADHPEPDHRRSVAGNTTKAPKTPRVLPRPVPTPGAVRSRLDQRQVADLWHCSSWPALLKAGKLAWDADIQAGDVNHPT